MPDISKCPDCTAKLNTIADIASKKGRITYLVCRKCKKNFKVSSGKIRPVERDLSRFS